MKKMNHSLILRSAYHLVGGVCLMFNSTACSSPDAITAPSGDPATFFEVLRVRERAVTLALGSAWDTAQLHVTATFGDGSPMLSGIRYSVSDSTIAVDSLGLITAQFPTTSLATVVAELTHLGLTRRDTVRVRVLPTAPTALMQRLSLVRPDGASNVITLLDEGWTLGTQALIIKAFDLLDNEIQTDEIIADLKSSDTSIAAIDETGLVTARRPGVVMIRVNALANGVFASDSIELTVGLPLVTTFRVLSPFSNQSPTWRLNGDTARIAVGGVIYWSYYGERPIDLIFDDTSHMAEVSAWPYFGAPGTGSGNITGFRQIPLLPDYSNNIESIISSGRARRFTKAGVYRFQAIVNDPKHSNQIHGVILVCPLSVTRCNP